MKRTIVFLFFSIVSYAQNVTFTPTGISPNSSAIYPHRTYDEIKALANSEPGDMVYDTSFQCLRVYQHGGWYCTDQNPFDFTPKVFPIVTSGGNGSKTVQGIATDGSGNIYVTGYFTGTADFGGTSKTSAGNADIFIAKYNRTGELIWIQTAGGSDGDYGVDIAVTAAGTVYVTGTFIGTAAFGSSSVTSAGSRDVFLAKYSSTGALSWVQRGGGTSWDEGRAVAIDPDGRVYITGGFSGNATFGSKTLTAKGSQDIFLVRYNQNSGIVEEATSAGGTGLNVVRAIAIDPTGKIYITGYTIGETKFGKQTINSSNTNYAFVAKYNPAGFGSGWNWAKKIEATGLGGDISDGYDLTTDEDGNVFITGYVNGMAKFNDILFSESITSYNRVFLVKCDTNGNFEWGKTLDGGKNSKGSAIALDELNNIYITGTYKGASIFRNKNLYPFGEDDVFISKYNNLGHLMWVDTMGGSDIDSVNGIVLDASNNIFATGTFRKTGRFGNVTRTAGGVGQMFIVRVDNP